MNAKVAYNKEDRLQKRYAQKQEQPPEKSEGCKKGCDVGLEPTTPRTTIWCSTN